MAGIDVGGCCEDLVPVAAGGQVMVWAQAGGPARLLLAEGRLGDVVNANAVCIVKLTTMYSFSTHYQ
jgi:hypothetical protein